ncbi:MAG TPA: M28 family peptidase [Saprospiraceae bacterium]|nr:M28 family peptidase [Saprospiraceae bacterium]HPN68258.1 M28 family peptidase [Saprospiraceae bacterium]
MCFALFFIVSSIQAQYISNVTKPDLSTPKITDASVLSVKYANTILESEMNKHLHIIASDKMGGRETGFEGNVLAAEYIKEQLKKWDVKPPKGMTDYFQPIALTYTSWDKTVLSIGDQTFRNLWDFISIPKDNNDLPSFTADEVQFLGYGIDQKNQKDYKKKKVKNKVILINEGEPMLNDSIYKLTGTTKPAGWTLEKKIALAQKKGVKLVLVLPSDFKATLNEKRRYVLSPNVTLDNVVGKKVNSPNVIYVSSNIAKAIIGEGGEEKIQTARDQMAKKGKFGPVIYATSLKADFTKKQLLIEGRNIAAYFEGKSKKDEYVIISAHYDHIGQRGDVIYYGADDNGSGTTTLLEITEALALAKKEGNAPERSILVIWMTGEEKGLLGSEYYSEHPIVPISQTVADINIDMVGRQDDKYAAQKEKSYIYVIGSDRLSTDLHKINEKVNNDFSKLVMDYTYNDENDPNRYYFRSDHYNFAKKDIPSIFFFSGVHADYHQPTDTPDKIMYDKMEVIGRHAFHLLWELASRPERIRVDGEIK